MIDISKNKEPGLLTSYRLYPGSDWEGDSTPICNFSEVKTAIRRALLEEQHFLCAYCMRKLRDDADSVRIEHIYPRELCNDDEEKKKLKLAYHNLVACCSGLIATETCCDVRKSNRVLSFTPVASKKSVHNIQNRISYSSEGKIEGDCSELTTELEEILGLNNHFLVSYREIAYKSFITFLNHAKKKGNGRILRKVLERKLKEYADSDKKEWDEYAGVFIYFLKKRLCKRVPVDLRGDA